MLGALLFQLLNAFGIQLYLAIPQKSDINVVGEGDNLTRKEQQFFTKGYEQS